MASVVRAHSLTHRCKTNKTPKPSNVKVVTSLGSGGCCEGAARALLQSTEISTEESQRSKELLSKVHRQGGRGEGWEKSKYDSSYSGSRFRSEKENGEGREKMLENESEEEAACQPYAMKRKLAVRNGVACQRRGERKIRRVNN